MKNRRFATSAVIFLITILAGGLANAGLFDGTGFLPSDRVSNIGAVTPARYLTGAVIGVAPVIWSLGERDTELHHLGIKGFMRPELGLGEAVQGRYLETGWLVTTGETLTLLALSDSYHHGGQETQVLFVAGYLGFRLYEVYDVCFGAVRHNRAVQKLSVSFKPAPRTGAVATLSWTYF